MTSAEITGGGAVPVPAVPPPAPLESEVHGPLVLIREFDDTWTVGCSGLCESWFVTLAQEAHARAWVLANLEGVPGHSCETALREMEADAWREMAEEASDEQRSVA